MFTIPAGTILYRYAPNICDTNKLKSLESQARYDLDTGKMGLYFGTFAITSLAMAVEYNNISLDLGVFKTSKEINVPIGKYRFREIYPERWKKDIGKKVLEDENISHFESLLLLGEKDSWFLPDSMQTEYEKRNGGEIFLSSNDLSKSGIKLIRRFKINPNVENAQNFYVIIKELNYPFDFALYCKYNLLVEMKCK